MADKVKITIDGTVHEVESGKNLLQVLLDQKSLIPHFCYHEALGPAGACRLCAAMIATPNPKGGMMPPRMDMTCMVRASEGMEISVNADYAKNFRKGVIEELMLNHPHDCPVCDEGGECMLQDMTVLSEHQHRRTRFPKRTWENQYLGPMVHHEMNRCITCYRCVRYYKDYALGDDLGVFGSRDRVYFGRVQDGVLESEFAGNLLDVCPTGVFTDKRFREVHTRAWDLRTAHSICPNCSVGCNMLPGFRGSEFRRIKPAENPAVNKFFICDRGRFGGEYVNSPARLKMARVNGMDMCPENAIDVIADLLREISQKHGAGSVAAIGSARASLEANAALALLTKVAGKEQVSYFTDARERETVKLAAAITVGSGLNAPSLSEIEAADFILNVGGDLTGEAPMIDLSVRQAIRAGHPYFEISPRAGTLDEFVRAGLRVPPGDEAAILSRIGSTAAGGPDVAFVQQVSTALASAKKPLILCSALHGDSTLIAAAVELAKKSSAGDRKCNLAFYYPGPNSVGVALAKNEIAPDALFTDIRAGKIKALVVLERDVTAEIPDFAELAGKCEIVVVIECYGNGTTEVANAVLPCLSHYESFGTFVNYEGRAQRFDGIPLPGPVMLASSEILLHIVQKMGAADSIGGTDFHDLYSVSPTLSRDLDRLAPGSAGVLIRGGNAPAAAASQKAAQNGALRRWDVVHIFGSETLSAMGPAIAELAPGFQIELHPDDAKSRNVADGQQIDLSVEFGVKGPVRINAKLAKGTAAVPVLLTESAVAREEVRA